MRRRRGSAAGGDAAVIESSWREPERFAVLFDRHARHIYRYLARLFALLTWLSGLGAVWLLWRPASSAFFRSARAARPRPPSQISGP